MKVKLTPYSKIFEGQMDEKTLREQVSYRMDNKMYMEAYLFCNYWIQKGQCVQTATELRDEAFPLMKQKSKKKERKNELIFIAITVIAIIIGSVAGLLT